MRHAIQHLIDGNDLTEAEAADVMRQIMEGTATPAQIAALAVALRMKGETVEEITGFARVMREYAVFVPVYTDKVVVDTCGTGGDSLKTFNVSTAAALVVAADGRLAVAKHGTGRPPASAAARTCWRPWASGWTCRPPKWASA